MIQTKNYFAPILQEFFDRVAHLEGTLYHLNVALTEFSFAHLEKYIFKGNQQEMMLGTALVISDLTGSHDNGWQINYPTGSNYMVIVSEYKQESHELINRESRYTIAQAYEAFSKLIKDFLAKYCELNSSIFDGEISEPRSFNLCRSFLDTIKSERYNKGYFKILRSICASLEQFEANNNTNLSLTTWYKCLGFVRNKITHSDCKFTADDREYIRLTSIEKKYLNMYFNAIKEGDQFEISLPIELGKKHLKLICEYAFLIFKELSQTTGQEWRVLKDMDREST
ncbi:MAG: hypothetical protein ACI8ZN_001975 [Bacteroidia bacterium]